MTRTMPIEEVDGHLAQIVSSLTQGDEIKLIAQDRPVARIIPEPLSYAPRRSGFGACKGMLIINRESDDHLADFEEYM